MSNSSRQDRGQFRRGDKIIEVMAVLLLGIATVGSAWCGYEATKWGSDEGSLSRRASDSQVEGARLFNLATQYVSYDSMIVSQYAQAIAAENDKLGQFYRDTLIRKEFIPILDQWQQQWDAGLSPTPLLDDQQYLDQQFGEYRLATAASADLTAQAQHARENADKYILTTLLLASGLFFAGVIGSFKLRFSRLALLFGAALAIAAAGARLAGLPVS